MQLLGRKEGFNAQYPIYQTDLYISLIFNLHYNYITKRNSISYGI
ncbi:MAG: hypothetical protein BWY18_00267 [Candidatus Cloacimonetes bacterium ADurb.Bin211]|jgi:hypothetical protein|nr:MAG: hypothetical protein BWY18_00267 [Candidatus Cloacimonetes bacterium ADurb.Bin211]